MTQDSINNLYTSKFSPGYYKTRHGQKSEVFAERDGRLYGRICTDNESVMRSEKMGYLKISPYWKATSWKLDGSAGHDPCSFPTNSDLMEPWEDNHD